jgi:hypothetical protein
MLANLVFVGSEIGTVVDSSGYAALAPAGERCVSTPSRGFSSPVGLSGNTQMIAMLNRPGVYEVLAMAVFAGMVLLFTVHIVPAIVD